MKMDIAHFEKDKHCLTQYNQVDGLLRGLKNGRLDNDNSGKIRGRRLMFVDRSLFFFLISYPDSKFL